MRFIPRRTKVKVEFLRGVTIGDIILGLIGLAVVILLIQSNFPYKFFYALGWTSIIVALFVPIADGIRLYATLGLLFRFFAFKKKYSKYPKHKYSSIKEVIPYDSILEERFISYNREYYAQVIEVRPMEFFMLSEYKQDLVIGTLANALKRLNYDQQASIVKINKAMIFDKYMRNEEMKYDNLMELQAEGQMSADEVEVRSHIFEARLDFLKYNNVQDKVYKDAFYIVIYDKDKEALEITTEGISKTMLTSPTPMNCHVLLGPELAVFLKANYGKDFDERDLEIIPLSEQVKWATPETIEFKVGKTYIDGQPYRQFAITDYPIQVPNGWGFWLFNLDKTKIVVNIQPINRSQAEKNIDKALIEMQTQSQYSFKSSKQIEYQTHLSTLKELLTDIKNSNEDLYDVNVHLVCEESAKKEVRATLKQNGFRFSEMFGRQVDAFVSNNISKLDTVKDYRRGIQTSSLAGMFPFISNALQDENGFYLGNNPMPVFIDFFKRDSERVNSNMVIMGRSGSGKSYAAKTLLCNLAADNTRIFIIDPEDEYEPLVKSLHGKLIDVGSSINGILNPFHINGTLQVNDADENKENSKENGNIKQGNEENSNGVIPTKKKKRGSDAYALHLQFLEQFLKIILEGIQSDAFELVNSLISDVYESKGIDSTTNISKLKPEDYPVFDDLYDLILQRVQEEKDPYHKRNYQIIENYIKKFAKGGRNSNLWNGPTSIETSENFVTFSFLSLIANRNEVITNAQMLLVFRYVENEIIRNKEFNKLYESNRKIVIAVDEAHIFINPKYPMALDFMAQLAKRIRKYNGMQIIITQNLKDFVGSPDIARQSSAVINASQYSMIFSLAPNDISDLVALYKNAGEINDDEQNNIVTAGIGECFIITGALSRTTLKITPLPYVGGLFE